MSYLIKKEGNNAYFSKNLGINWNHWVKKEDAKRYATKVQAIQIIRQYKLKNVVIEEC